MTIRIQLPDGTVGEFPDNMSDAQITAVLKRQFPAQDTAPEVPEGMVLDPATGQMVDTKAIEERNKQEQSGVGGGILATAGGWLDGIPLIGDKLIGGAKSLAAGAASMTGGPSYDEGMKALDGKYEAAAAAHPVLNTAAQIGGGISALAPIGSTALGARALGITGPNLLARAGASAASNAALSAGDTAINGGSADQIIGSAELGGLIGGVVPIAGKVISKVSKPVADAIKARTNPSAFADQKILERVASDGKSMSQIGNRMNGTGLSIADAGGQATRNLLKTTTNIPGPAQQAVKSKLTLQAMGQGDRIKKVIGDTLADPEGFLTAKDDIAAEAQRLAAPLYQRARATPVHYSQTLEGILETPAGKAALAKAEQLAANEQVPFQQLFVNIAPNGTSATVKRVPDARGWDYIKRAMDDMIDGQTDAITKKVSNEGRILIGLKNKMLSEVDSVNPAYAAARRVWGGQKQLDDALEFGKKAMTMPPEAVERHISKLGSADQKALQVGAAEWARSVLDKGGFTQNAIIKLFGNRHQVRIWKAIFGDEQKFKTFRQAMFAEAKKRETYNVVTGNSSTVKQAADLADAGGLNEMFQTGKTLATQGPVSATLQFLSSRMKMLGGMTPKVADEVSKRLMARDPAQARAIINQLTQIQNSNATALAKRQAAMALITSVTAQYAGSQVNQ